MIALMKSSKVIQVIHYEMVYPGGALKCQVHLQLMWFVKWIHCVGVLVFLSDSAMKNAVTETSSVTEMRSVTETSCVTVMNSAIVTSSVTGSLPMTDFVKCCYLVQKNMSI